MKIDFMLIVLNGEPWIEAWLKTYEPHARKIFVIEGTDSERFNCVPDEVKKLCRTSDGHSVDRTREIVRGFGSDKVVLIDESPDSGDGFWKSKNHMVKQVNGRVEADYLWEADCDEFLHQGDIEQVKKCLRDRPEVLVWQFDVFNFWRSISHIVQGGWVSKYRRIFKWKPGVTKFCNHRPPTTTTDGPPVTLPCSLYHYSYVLEKDARYKPFYHQGMYGKGWFERKWLAWTPKNRKSIEVEGIGPARNFGRSWTKPVDVKHPEFVKPVLKGLVRDNIILP
jgi:hypothetical protein